MLALFCSSWSSGDNGHVIELGEQISDFLESLVRQVYLAGLRIFEMFTPHKLTDLNPSTLMKARPSHRLQLGKRELQRLRAHEMTTAAKWHRISCACGSDW